MFKLIKDFLFIIFFLLTNFSFALSGEEVSNNFCIKNKYFVEWFDNVKVNTLVKYTLKTKENLSIKWSVVFKLFFSWDLEQVVTGTTFSFYPEKQGIYILLVDIKENNCNYEIKKEIKVYKNIYFYIGVYNDKLSLLNESIFKKKWILLEALYIPPKWFYTQEELLNRFIRKIYYLKAADYIFINFPQISYIFDVLKKIQLLYSVNFSTKKIYLIEKQRNNLLKKLLIKYMRILKIDTINIVLEKNLLDFFDALTNSKDRKNYIYTYKLTLSSISKWYILSYIVDWLLFQWFPSNLLAIFLLSSLVLLVISFFRQVIWFSVFWVYNPLLFWLSLYILWIKFSFIVLIIWIFAILLTNLFVKRIYLLYTAKMSLFFILYFLILLFSFYFLKQVFGLSLVKNDIFKNILVIFPIFSVGIVATKLISEDMKIMSVKFLVSLIEFFILSFITYWIYKSIYLQNLLLVYPDIVFVILVINLLIWRFTGLQLFEYFRFMPLIKKELEEE